MKTSHLPARHGKDHAEGGYDPIPGITGIRFDVDNEGGYLLIVANDDITSEDTSIRIEARGAVGDLELTSDGNTIITGGTGIQLQTVVGSIVLASAASPLTINVNGQTFSFKDDGTIELPGGGIIGP